MKSVLFALAALLCYSIANTVIDRKLTGISPLASTTYIYIGLATISIPLLFFRDQLGIKLTMPTTPETQLLLGCAVLFFFADLAWFQAYHTPGGRIEQITATFLAFPLLTALMKGVSSGVYPTRSDLVSWAVVAAGLIISVRQPFK